MRNGKQRYSGGNPLVTSPSENPAPESRKPLRVPLRRFTLGFTSAELQDEYAAQFWATSRQFVRFSLSLATGLYLLFGILDWLMVPEQAGRILLIRLGVVSFLVATFLLTFRPSFVRYFQGAMTLVILLTGGGILGMIAMAGQASGYRYYAGLMLVVMFGQAMLRLRFIYATLATWLVILGYEAINMTLLRAPGSIITNNSFFLVASNILGMFTSYGVELSLKTVFWQRRMLVEKQFALNVEHSRKTSELKAARELQLAMLPMCNPHHPVMDICFSMTTATEVGGDYYDYVEAPDGTLTLVIADAAGHGAQAGVLVGAMKMMFSNHAEEDGVEEFLQRASQHLRAMRLPRMFLAAAAAKVRHNAVEIAGAGLPSAILYRRSSGAVEHLSLKGIPLGTFADVAYSAKTVVLEPGDLVVFMTDGILESTNSRGEMFGQERADAAVARSAAGRAADIVSALQDAASSWGAGVPRTDDMTFLVIKRKIPRSPSGGV